MEHWETNYWEVNEELQNEQDADREALIEKLTRENEELTRENEELKQVANGNDGSPVKIIDG